MNAITTIAPDDVAADRSLLNIVAMAVRDPAIDVAKLETLLRMQREIVADDARLQFNRSMSLAQGEMQPVLRDAANDQTKSRYARLETIDAAVRPIYTRHGFCLEFNSEAIEGPNGQAAERTAVTDQTAKPSDVPEGVSRTGVRRTRIVCEVSHTAGHTKKFQLEAAPDMTGPQGKANKTPLHGLGSTVSYLRRYLLCMVFNIVLTSDDNDGNRQQRGNENGQLTEAQVEELHDLMARGRIREGSVIEKMAPGLRSISQLPPNDFPRVKNALLSRLNVLDQRVTAERAAAARQSQGDRP